MTGPRRERVSDLIQEEVARLLQTSMHDLRLKLVTVTGVSMSNDLRHARIYVSMLAEGAERDIAMATLDAARGFIRTRLSQALSLRYTPELTFTYDSSLEQGARIERLLDEVQGPPNDDDPREK
jgi:ribosome-binding factor A